MRPKINSRSWFRRLLPATLGVGVVVLLASTLLLTRATGFAASAASVPTFQAQRGPLTISVIESGAIKSQEQVILKNEVEGQTTLIYLIPEGTRVQEGQLLAELDASKLHDDRVEQQIRVENAEAAFIGARENLAVVRNQADSDISKAQLAYDFAQEDVTKYLEGEYPQELREAESKITIAREETERASEKLQWSERLFQEKYISQTELEADRLTFKRADLEHQLAVAAKELLEGYTHKRQVAQLESDVQQTERALERTKLKANADIVQAEAQLKAKEAEFEQQKSKLAKIDEQIGKSKLVAPRAGLVVYATSTRTGGRGGMTQPLEEGQTVRERQELIYLPSTEAMMAELMIHESSLEKVQVGQPVKITVDAMSGKVFTGQVTSIAPLPDAQNMFMNPDRKVYATKVYLDGSNSELRTGMSCRAEIMIQKLEDATYVPVQAVVRVAGQPTVYVQSGNDLKPRSVTTGLDNSSMVHIVSGLAAGEVVSLAPPLDAGTARFAAGPAPADAALAGGREVPPEVSTRPSAERGPRPSGDQLSEEERAARRERFQNLTPEERAERRRRMEAMTPEQREEAMRRMRERQSGGSPGNSEPRP
jgi:HlyD family secretion protein